VQGGERGKEQPGNPGGIRESGEKQHLGEDSPDVESAKFGGEGKTEGRKMGKRTVSQAGR